MSGNILLLSTSNFVIKTNKPNCTDMTTKTALPLIALLCLCMQLSAQPVSKRQLQIKRTAFPITIDGELKEEVWKTAPMADKFTEFQPTPFKPEEAANGTQFYFLYNNEGIYVGGYCHERNKDSISAELIGRDGFGNNDFVGFVFDTYNDKLNGFEYFVTPLGEQMYGRVPPNYSLTDGVLRYFCRIRRSALVRKRCRTGGLTWFGAGKRAGSSFSGNRLILISMVF